MTDFFASQLVTLSPSTVNFGNQSLGTTSAAHTVTLTDGRTTSLTGIAVSITGANVGDAVAPGWPSGIETGLIGSMRISAPDTVAVRLCNFSGGTVSPASATYRAMIVRSF